VDPSAGSLYVDSLPNELAENTWKLIQEVEEVGGMTKAIEAGIPKLRMEEAAAGKQAGIDSRQELIVGVNKFRVQHEDPVHILDVDNQMVRKQQIERLEKIKATRNTVKVNQSLEKLIHCAKTGKGNLLEIAIEAARNRATLGEISDALESIFGRFKAQ